MTAMSAPRASETPSIANRLATDPTEIRLPGSDRTYEVRDVLRGMGLRWDPATHAWHGRLIAAQRAFLERQFALATRVVVPIESFAPPEPSVAVEPSGASTRPLPPVGPRGPPRDYSRTRFESRLLLPGPDEDADEIATPTRTFSLAEVTSGLPDDSREADERAEARRLREARRRVKFARTIVSTTPGLAEALELDWRKAAAFYARFGVTESSLRHGVPADGF